MNNPDRTSAPAESSSERATDHRPGNERAVGQPSATPAEPAEKIRELERRNAESAAALEAANEELLSFAYSVSHDLRAPLRAIEGFARILVDDHAGRLSAEGQHCAQVIVSSAKQMSLLIDALLTFSRISQAPLEKLPIDMSALARTVCTEIRSAHREHFVEVEIADLLPAMGEPSLIRQVFSRLLNNAFKFTRGRADARIEIGSSREASHHVYFVRDNGIGFDMRYASKLFGMFQRLHRAEEFEGVGSGLAIVKRIVQRHGGRVWAEGKVNEGACFSFSLPAD